MNRRLLVLAFGVYLLIAVIVTFPLILNLSSALVGYVHGDGYEMAHHIWWINHALRTGQNPFLVTNLAYPDGLVGVTLWSNPLQFFPAWLLAYVLPIPAAANVTILGTLALNGAAMFGLAKYLLKTEQRTEIPPPTPRDLHSPLQNGGTPFTASAPTDSQKAVPIQTGRAFVSSLITHHSSLSFLSAFLAGLIFMLYPTMQGHLGAGHAGLLVQWGVPLYVYALLRLADKPRYVWLAALGFILSAAGHTLQLIYVTLPLTAVIALWFVLRREWLPLRRLISASVIGAAGMAILVLPVLGATVDTPAYEQGGDTVRYSADLLAIVTPSFNHPLFGELAYTHRVLGVNLDEGAAYAGVVAALLALVALVRVKAARLWGWIALLAWILSLGVLLKVFDQPIMLDADGYRSTIAMPFALVADLPIFNLARTPGRFAFLLAFAVAIMAGYGGKIVLARIKRPPLRWIGLIGLCALISFEYQTFFPLPTIPAEIPTGISALASRGDVRAIFSAPFDNLIAAKTDLYWQTAHGLPLIAGQVTRQTPVDPAKLNLLQTFDPALLDQAGADVVLIHRAYDDGSLERTARERLGEPFYVDNAVALFDTPDPVDPPAFTVLLPPEGDIGMTSGSLVAPESGWALLTGTLSGDGRAVNLLLNDQVVHRWQVDGDSAIRVPLFVNGYATVRLALDPPCPLNTDPALACRSVNLSAPNIAYAGGAPETPIYGRFERGVSLVYASIPETLISGESLSTWLYWSFGQARTENEIRYVHVIDTAGQLVGQQDNPLGLQPAGSAWAEEVLIHFETPLASGEYRVYVGWYTYPEITPFCVVTMANLCTDQREVLIGTFRVEQG